jgi:integrase
MGSTLLNRLVKYLGTDKIMFNDITYSLLVSFNNELLGDGVKLNSISNYFRALRAIYNKGVKEKLTDRSNSPFYDFSIKTEKTKKRAISKASIQVLKATSLTKGTSEWHAINYFLLSFYLIGISFTDLAYLKPDNIQDGRLIFKRRKTHKWYNIKLFVLATDMMFDYYMPGNTYILPILPNDVEEDTEQCKKLIYQWIKTTNKYLKRIGSSHNIEVALTTYVSRHAWATIAKKLGYSNDLIAEALGHSFGNRVTNIYLDDFDKEMVDEMHKAVIQ